MENAFEEGEENEIKLESTEKEKIEKLLNKILMTTYFRDSEIPPTPKMGESEMFEFFDAEIPKIENLKNSFDSDKAVYQVDFTKIEDIQSNPEMLKNIAERINNSELSFQSEEERNKLLEILQNHYKKSDENDKGKRLKNYFFILIFIVNLLNLPNQNINNNFPYGNVINPINVLRQNQINNLPNLPLALQMNPNMMNKMIPFMNPNNLKINPNSITQKNFNQMNNNSNNPINTPMNINMNINMNMNFPNQLNNNKIQNIPNANIHPNPNMMNLKPYGNNPQINMFNQMNSNFNHINNTNNNSNDRKLRNFGQQNSQGN